MNIHPLRARNYRSLKKIPSGTYKQETARRTYIVSKIRIEAHHALNNLAEKLAHLLIGFSVTIDSTSRSGHFSVWFENIPIYLSSVDPPLNIHSLNQLAEVIEAMRQIQRRFPQLNQFQSLIATPGLSIVKLVGSKQTKPSATSILAAIKLKSQFTIEQPTKPVKKYIESRQMYTKKSSQTCHSEQKSPRHNSLHLRRLQSNKLNSQRRANSLSMFKLVKMVAQHIDEDQFYQKTDKLSNQQISKAPISSKLVFPANTVRQIVTMPYNTNRKAQVSRQRIKSKQREKVAINDILSFLQGASRQNAVPTENSIISDLVEEENNTRYQNSTVSGIVMPEMQSRQIQTEQPITKDNAEVQCGTQQDILLNANNMLQLQDRNSRLVPIRQGQLNPWSSKKLLQDNSSSDEQIEITNLPAKIRDFFSDPKKYPNWTYERQKRKQNLIVPPCGSIRLYLLETLNPLQLFPSGSFYPLKHGKSSILKTVCNFLIFANPSLIMRLFENPDKLSPTGDYVVWLMDDQENLWKNIQVNDSFKIESNGQIEGIGIIPGGFVWLMILEKALKMFLGSRINNGGLILRTLLGCPFYQFSITSIDNLFSTLSTAFVKDKVGKIFLQAKDGNAISQSNLFDFCRILSYDEDKKIVNLQNQRCKVQCCQVRQLLNTYETISIIFLRSTYNFNLLSLRSPSYETNLGCLRIFNHSDAECACLIQLIGFNGTKIVMYEQVNEFLIDRLEFSDPLLYYDNKFKYIGETTKWNSNFVEIKLKQGQNIMLIASKYKVHHKYAISIYSEFKVTAAENAAFVKTKTDSLKLDQQNQLITERTSRSKPKRNFIRSNPIKRSFKEDEPLWKMNQQHNN